MSTLYRYADLDQPIPESFPSPVKNRVKIAPATAGQYFPEFFIEEEQIINRGGLLTHVKQGASLHEFTAQPLVLAFYSLHWNSYSDIYLEELKVSHSAIEAIGTRLLVVSDEDKATFNDFHRQQLPFDIVADAEHRIATEAGIYRDTDPIWGRVSGVNADVPIPAVYLIAPSLEITHAFTDPYFQGRLSVARVLEAVGKELAISA
ncbi:MAG TPA: redoxin domain-containing protein [Chitinophaga sp.]|uniref:redoxin domain-containing protein n=1 Tax=Chitinophaga sp. TaxID=1869181 RepID=UPI002BE7C37E|nr:redoxin domain-containing protein [Chitinophaga sp.]HVI46862.1 redoxin domain-containing protein [Chitinophaga sp.]